MNTTCRLTELLLDGRLDAAGEDRARRHMEVCEACSGRFAQWQEVRSALGEMVPDPPGRHPNPYTARKILEAALEPEGHGRVRVWLPRALGAVAAAACLVLVLMSPKGDGGVWKPGLVAMRVETPSGLSERTGALREVLRTGEGERAFLELRRDRVVLAENSAASVRERSDEVVRLALERGEIGCSVERRDEDQVFVVDAGDISVSVIGTEFSVRLIPPGDFELRVVSGVVVVSKGEVPRWKVRGGQRLRVAPGEEAVLAPMEPFEEEVVSSLFSTRRSVPEDGPVEGVSLLEDRPRRKASIEPIEEEIPPTMEAVDDEAAENARRWRAWIIDGRYDDAGAALEAHLAGSPDDAEALSLLADCRRKQGSWSRAVDLYREVVRREGGKGRGRRALFMAAVITQERLGDHREAIALLEEYLMGAASASPLRAAAMVRKARSHIALGEMTKAGEILERVSAIQEEESPLGREARRMMERMGGL